MREKRDEIIILRTTKAEKSRIYEKMLGMGIRSLSAYIRKMALDGWTFYYHKVSDFYTNQYDHQNQGHSHCDYFFFFSHHK